MITAHTSMFLPTHLPPAMPTTEAWYFVFVGKQLCLPAGLAERFLPISAQSDWLHGATRHYLGALAGSDCWALGLDTPPPGWQLLSLRAAMMAMTAEMLPVASRAAQVMEWDRSHRFCGVCGTATELKQGERARVCPACGHLVYPRISPAMMALVWRPGEILLARSPGFTPGVYSALAGFVEAGESVEDCVLREVHEEVGVRVADLAYYGSQNWPFPHSLMLAFTARWVEGEIVPQAGEIEHAAWFALDALPPIPPRFSISGYLIRDTVARLQAGELMP
ncbi:NAD(+) diphosphatase [Chitinimonas sp. BJYL2]|uniref:NAD(+) diphosphatase n=1 Tax=Chitinimonas sp. BJYL2 TaxID=2976696 RepID=UPI0022B4AEBC|nr:NAD(+) diphosphatase [Chitinimonas sp. BJYL2]